MKEKETTFEEDLVREETVREIGEMNQGMRRRQKKEIEKIKDKGKKKRKIRNREKEMTFRFKSLLKAIRTLVIINSNL